MSGDSRVTQVMITMHRPMRVLRSMGTDNDLRVADDLFATNVRLRLILDVCFSYLPVVSSISLPKTV